MQRLLYRLAFALPMLVPAAAFAAPANTPVFNGPGLSGGLTEAQTITGPANKTFREIVVTLISYVLSFVALAAVIAIIIAGIWLIVGMGSDDSKTRAKHIIQYTLIGLVIIILSRIIVGLFINEVPTILGF